MQRESWLTYPATSELVFHTPSDQIWKTIMKQMGWQERLFADSPDDRSPHLKRDGQHPEPLARVTLWLCVVRYRHTDCTRLLSWTM